ncbi:MAG: HAD family hydrolase [Candidatus Lokiarchaeota archaeon]|nr:HAD family hydrolase [Candidatus Lokiarchaeota archaeon]
MTMNLNGIFFDLGFTLIEIKNFQLKNYTHLLKNGLLDLEHFLEKKGMIEDSNSFYNIARKVQKECFKKYFETEKEFSTEFILELSFKKLNIPFSDELLEKSAEIYHKYEIKAWELKEGVKDTLEELSQNYKLAIISNAIYHKGILQILKNLKIEDYFDFVLSSAKIGVKKPNKEIFIEALNNLKLESESCCFVGDDIHADIFGAKRLGFKTIQIKRSFYLPTNNIVDVIPDFQISEIPEILKIIEKI